ncbi:MAG: glycosyltransferase [Candidatus Binataceae bacterium]|nr:glycosyltransferase [Candidatus Binataceae bacterium]
MVTANARVAGGVERYLDAVIPALAGAGHAVALLAEREGPRDRPRIAAPAALEAWSVADHGAARALEVLAAWRPDLIYAHGLEDAEVEARAMAAAPAVAFAHDYRATCISGAKSFARPAPAPCTRVFGAGCLGQFYPRRCGGLNPYTMIRDYRAHAARLELRRRLRMVLTASQYMRREYLRHGFASAMVRCVGLPIAEPPRALGAPRGAGNAIDPSGPARLLFAGRMEPAKGGSLMFDAMPLAATALGRRLTLTCAGDGRERARWQSHAAGVTQAHRQVQIAFTGWIGDGTLAPLIDAADLLIVPSVWPEPFGLIGAEAAMRGLPAAAFAVGGIPEWLANGVNGWLAPGDEPTAAGLAVAIAKCLRDPREHARLRCGAIAEARRFAPALHLAALTAVFDEVAGADSRT